MFLFFVEKAAKFVWFLLYNFNPVKPSTFLSEKLPTLL